MSQKFSKLNKFKSLTSVMGNGALLLLVECIKVGDHIEWMKRSNYIRNRRNIYFDNSRKSLSYSFSRSRNLKNWFSIKLSEFSLHSQKLRLQKLIPHYLTLFNSRRVLYDPPPRFFQNHSQTTFAKTLKLCGVLFLPFRCILEKFWSMTLLLHMRTSSLEMAVQISMVKSL